MKVYRVEVTLVYYCLAEDEQKAKSFVHGTGAHVELLERIIEGHRSRP